MLWREFGRLRGMPRGMSPIQSLIFDLRVANRDRSEVGSVKVRVGQPQPNHALTRWECQVVWEGAAEGNFRIYGATSIQCLTLALQNLQGEMATLFPGKEITEAGVPWLLDGVSEE